jgi:hypothetical protein
MYFLRKLKPDWDITGLLPVISLLTLFFIVLIFFGFHPAFKVLGLGIAVIAIFTIISFVRTNSYGYLMSAIYVSSLAIFVNTLPIEYLESGGKLPPFSQFMAFVTVFFLIWVVILLLTRRTKWRGREVFEMAAQNVDDVSEGFTTRPLAAGKIDATKSQILGFAEFLKRNLVAMPYKEESRVVIVPVMMGREYEFLYRPNTDYLNKSWIAIDFKGNISVSMAKNDYLTYQENYSFDQLCNGLGQVFIEFFEMYKKGEGVRILDKLNSLRINVFS